MKFTIKFLCLMVGLLLQASIANAESLEGQLQQMVTKLQSNPADNLLRESIIKYARELKPAPALPEAAIEFEGRAQFAFKNAKSNDDYLAAAHEYEKAVTNAPWVTGYYADICTIYEKAGKFEEAKRNCEFSLIGLTDPVQITDIKRRIAGLKYGIEKSSPSAVAEQQKTQESDRLRKLLSSLEGGVWSGESAAYELVGKIMYKRYGYEVRNGMLIEVQWTWYSDQPNPVPWENGSVALTGNRITYNPHPNTLDQNCGAITVQISENEQIIEKGYSCYGRQNNFKFSRKQ